MNTAITKPLEKILDSDDTTVGGGSSSALVGAMAAGMIGMVAKLSRKKPVNFTLEQYDTIASECDKLAIKLQQGSLEDMEAYSSIVDAFRLPKSTEEEKTIRSKAIQASATKAAEVPLDNARMNARVHELGTMLKGNSNPACLSDLLAGLYLSESGVKDCILNVNANLSLIKDESTLKKLKSGMLDLLLQIICY